MKGALCHSFAPLEDKSERSEESLQIQLLALLTATAMQEFEKPLLAWDRSVLLRMANPLHNREIVTTQEIAISTPLEIEAPLGF